MSSTEPSDTPIVYSGPRVDPKTIPAGVPYDETDDGHYGPSSFFDAVLAEHEGHAPST